METLNLSRWPHNIDTHTNTDIIDSRKVCTALGVQHVHFVRIVDALLDDFPDIKNGFHEGPTAEQFSKVSRVYRGTHYDVYLMNQAFFRLAVMRLKSVKARQYQRDINTAASREHVTALENALLAAKEKIVTLLIVLVILAACGLIPALVNRL